MVSKNYNDRRVRGLDHVEAWANDPIDRPLHFLETGSGSMDGCLRSVGRNAQSMAMIKFFRDGDLLGMKQWASVVAKTRIMLAHLHPGESYLTEELLWPLISDDEEVIDWYRQHHAMYVLEKSVSGGDKDDPKSWMFYRYQSWLALNACWDELRERCERILAMQDEIKKDRSYLIDHRFYLALAKGDKAEMEKVLLEKTTPIERKHRHDQESALTNNFIVSSVVIFAKLAWRNGHDVELNTPWVPCTWLPIAPLPKYDAPWLFMQTFDIWQPFRDECALLSPKRRASE